MTEATMRKKANVALAELGREYHDGLPIGKIDQILTEHGFQPTEEAIYCGADGRSHEQVGERSWITISWHKMEVSGRYEIVAYLS